MSAVTSLTGGMGRRVVTGLDGAGRSCFTHDDPVPLATANVGLAWATDAIPADNAAPCPPPPANPLALMHEGRAVFLMINAPPGHFAPMHTTETIDYLTVVSGEITLITEAGEKAYTTYPDPEAFYKEACRLYAAWKALRDTAEVQPGEAAQFDTIEDAAEKLSVTVEAALDHSWAEIAEFLHSSDPFEFQEMVADLLRGMGYHVSWVSPPGKDNGVDVIAFTDPLGTTGPRIKAQVKRWQSKVDSDGLKSFLATLSNGDVGIYVCLAGFTKDAHDYARNQESRRVTLIDARRFFELWVEHYQRLADQARRRLPITPVYFLAPSE